MSDLGKYWNGKTIWPIALAAMVALQMACAIFGAWMPGPLASPGMLLALAITLVATITDLRSRRIPNWLSYPAMLAGAGMVLAGALTGWSEAMGMPDAMEAMGGFLLGATLLGLLYLSHGGGAGDVKLAAALGILLGPGALAGTLLAGCIAAGFGALGVVVLRLLQQAQNPSSGGRLSNALRGNMPMAPFFLAGLLLHLMN
jgi:Flp pilus assembly protein protease CpaA